MSVLLEQKADPNAQDKEVRFLIYPVLIAKYCKFTIIRESFTFANIREFHLS